MCAGKRKVSQEYSNWCREVLVHQENSHIENLPLAKEQRSKVWNLSGLSLLTWQINFLNDKISAKDMSGTFLITLWYESEDEKLSLETFKSNWHEIIHTSLFSCQHMLNENIPSKYKRMLTV